VQCNLRKMKFNHERLQLAAEQNAVKCCVFWRLASGLKVHTWGWCVRLCDRARCTMIWPPRRSSKLAEFLSSACLVTCESIVLHYACGVKVGWSVEGLVHDSNS